MALSQSDANGPIIEKLDLIVKLLAAMYTRGANKTESITKLADLSLSNKQISEIVGVSGAHVSQTLYMKNKTAAGNAAKKRKSDGKQEISTEPEVLNS